MEAAGGQRRINGFKPLTGLHIYQPAALVRGLGTSKLQRETSNSLHCQSCPPNKDAPCSPTTQTNYKDGANVDDNAQERIFNIANERLEPFSAPVFMRCAAAGAGGRVVRVCVQRRAPCRRFWARTQAAV